jgi:hypothetical protein
MSAVNLSQWSDYELKLLKKWRRDIKKQAIASGSSQDVIAARLFMQCGDIEALQKPRLDLLQRVLRHSRGKQSHADFHDSLALIDAALRGNAAIDAGIKFNQLVGAKAEVESEFYVRRIRHALGGTVPGDRRMDIVPLSPNFAVDAVDIPALPVHLANGRSIPGSLSVSIPVRRANWIEVDGIDVLGTGILFGADGMLLNDPAGNPGHGPIAGWWPHLSSHLSAPDQATLHSVPDVIEQRLPTAVIGAARCSANYWHNLVEYIPAVVRAVDESGCDVVLWSADAPDTATEALLRCRNVKLIKIASTARVHVGKAIVPIFASCQFDSPIRPFTEQCGFDVHEVASTYSALKSLNSTSGSMPQRVVLIRGNGLSRPTKNIQVFLDAVSDDGFVILDPGELSLDEQIELFGTAKQIVGFGGAMWANLFFANPDLRIANVVSEPMSLYLGHRHIAKSLNLDFKTFAVPASRDPNMWESFMYYMHVGLSIDSQLWNRIRRTW